MAGVTSMNAMVSGSEWKTSIKWFFCDSPLHFDPAVIDIPEALIDDYLSKMIQDWLMAGKYNAVVGLPPQLLLYFPSWPSYLPLERHALKMLWKPKVEWSVKKKRHVRNHLKLIKDCMWLLHGTWCYFGNYTIFIYFFIYIYIIHFIYLNTFILYIWFIYMIQMF